MKIQQLPMGARFEYEGQAYVKTGPQVGSGEGGQRLIPKYAVLRVADGSVPPPAAPPKSPDRARIHAAFETYHARCAALVAPEQQPALQDARAAFYQAIE